MANKHLRKLSDSELYQLCKEYGLRARQSVRKFAGLLPEVQRRRLYRRRGCASIYEFAAKLAGMSQRSVDKVLNLAKRLEDKPFLKEQLITGSQGWTKIEKVASVATSTTDQLWAKRVETMPQLALEVLVREQNNREDLTLKSHVESKNETSQPVARERFSFEVDEKTALRFRQFKQRLEKTRGETVSFGEVLKALLNQKAGAPKSSTVQTCPECTAKTAQEEEMAEAVSETIPVAVQRVVLARQEERCAFPGCNRPPDIFHHSRRFALIPGHDPNFIVALCKAHERLAHCGLIGNEERPPKEWIIREWPDELAPKYEIDRKVAMYRRE